MLINTVLTTFLFIFIMDDLGVYHGENIFRLAEQGGGGDASGTNGIVDHLKEDTRRRFKAFLTGYHDGDGVFKYQEQLRDHVLLSLLYVEIKLDDLTRFDEDLADKVRSQPNELMPILEIAAREVADFITRPRVNLDTIDDMQVIIKMDADPLPIRDLKSDFISKIQVVSGIIISASNVRAKAVKVALQCRSCKELLKNITVKPGLDGFMLPRKCSTDQSSRTVKCPIDPYFIVPNQCTCQDFQLLKLQETPESVPYGEMPRHLRLYVDRYLREQVVPGNRVTIAGILTIKPGTQAGSGVRQPYMRVLGMESESEGPGRSLYDVPFSDEEKMLFRHYAASGKIYDMIVKSLAPSIYGSTDIKKAIACLLFGGSRKKLPDGLNRRGDINVLLLGDPGTAKSQLLKFVEKVSPIGVYTSGKGSSAAGLTASVIRDPSSHNFVMEGGAMVLADGGVVCIDEFDKMREDDRVAIHEAMEQQTISIAKAGITCTLNSRCAVLAAANSVFGRWDDTRGDKNIDFMPTILSRFDMIFIVRDEHDMARDAKLAEHVFNVHNKSAQSQQEQEGELPLNVFKKYIAYCRS